MSELMAEVLANELLAEDHFRLRLLGPEIAKAVLPGQFVMLRNPEEFEPFLPRAYSIHNISSSRTGSTVDTIEILYKVVGKMTRLLGRLKPEETLSVWGPLGRAFTTGGAKKAAFVAGGIGIAPFLFLAKILKREGVKGIRLFFGACSKEHLVGVDDFQELGVEVHLATEDGSHGHKGLVTEVFKEELAKAGRGEGLKVYGCGPYPMLEALAEICSARDVSCEVSLEAMMACGIGACQGCPQAILDESDVGFHYELVCKEGPVFDAARIKWDRGLRG